MQNSNQRSHSSCPSHSLSTPSSSKRRVPLMQNHSGNLIHIVPSDSNPDPVGLEKFLKIRLEEKSKPKSKWDRPFKTKSSQLVKTRPPNSTFLREFYYGGLEIQTDTYFHEPINKNTSSNLGNQSTQCDPTSILNTLQNEESVEYQNAPDWRPSSITVRIHPVSQFRSAQIFRPKFISRQPIVQKYTPPPPQKMSQIQMLMFLNNTPQKPNYNYRPDHPRSVSTSVTPDKIIVSTYSRTSTVSTNTDSTTNNSSTVSIQTEEKESELKLQ